MPQGMYLISPYQNGFHYLAAYVCPNITLFSNFNVRYNLVTKICRYTQIYCNHMYLYYMNICISLHMCYLYTSWVPLNKTEILSIVKTMTNFMRFTYHSTIAHYSTETPCY